MLNNQISSQDFFQIFSEQKDNIILIDVRNSEEFESCYVPGAINIPLDVLERGNIPLFSKKEKIYLLCQNGFRSARALELLRNKGFTELYLIEGGYKECLKNVPQLITKHSSYIPLIRQIQILAGFLVVLGIILSQLLFSGFLLLSFFVGCALVFEGVNGFWGSSLLLQKMPWNKLEK